MDIIVASDVFGKTSELITLCEDLDTIKIIDPYNGIDMGFKSESEAYSYFMAHMRIDAYLAIILKQVEQIFTTVHLYYCLAARSVALPRHSSFSASLCR
ncbi:hypothetical protein Ping_1542 [Psychromonas ingrahamii 37]|uniref:Uncharacterized protein n=2 Tax=Psychromonas ingrahamii TaxID=357794 RepID=A1SV35_PSYIN|nr:hypothetical protein Ping_1542 [Psychromonas ingrahamii 37]